jgi:hypothetical protein
MVLRVNLSFEAVVQVGCFGYSREKLEFPASNGENMGSTGTGGSIEIRERNRRET